MSSAPSKTVCLQCHLSTTESVILKCDHEICMKCAESIKILENNPLDVKYKLSCPFCQTNTFTLSISNLISKEQEKCVFMNMEESELSEHEFEKNPQNYESTGPEDDLRLKRLKEMTYNERIAMIYTRRRTPDVQMEKSSRKSSVDMRQRASKSRQGYNEACQHQKSDESIEVQCPSHPKNNVIFYCREDNELLCMQCMYRHMKEHKDHNISSIKDAMPLIEQQNRKFKVEAREKISEIDTQLNTWKVNKAKLEQAFLFLDQMIKKQFRELEVLLKTKEAEVNEYLESVFDSKESTMSLKYEEMNEAKQVLLEYYRYPIEGNTFSQIYFFSNFADVKASYEESLNQYKVKEFNDEDLLCFNRNSTTKDFERIVDKLFIPKVDGRQSSSRSRAPSRSNIEKSKVDLREIPEEALKSVKRKMKQINKKAEGNVKELGKGNKRYDFLQNLALDDTLPKKEKERSLNQKKTSTAWTPTPQPQMNPLKKKKN